MPARTDISALMQVKRLLRGRKIITIEDRGKIIKEYGQHLGGKKGYGYICGLICKDVESYLEFKKWLDATINWTYTPKIK